MYIYIHQTHKKNKRTTCHLPTVPLESRSAQLWQVAVFAPWAPGSSPAVLSLAAVCWCGPLCSGNSRYSSHRPATWPSSDSSEGWAEKNLIVVWCLARLYGLRGFWWASWISSSAHVSWDVVLRFHVCLVPGQWIHGRCHPELAMLLSCIVKEPCLRGPSDIQMQKKSADYLVTGTVIHPKSPEILLGQFHSISITLGWIDVRNLSFPVRTMIYFQCG